jgi:uncharacterized membrane protein YkoI
MKAVMAIGAVLMLLFAGAALAENLRNMDFEDHPADAGTAVQIADQIPYVDGFGVVKSVDLTDDYGRPAWDVKIASTDGNELNVVVDQDTGLVTKVDPNIYEATSVAAHTMTHREMIDRDYTVYGAGMDMTDFEMRVKVSSIEAMGIIQRMQMDLGDLDKTELIDNHGMLTWQMVFGPVDGTTLVRIDAHDGFVTKVSTDLVDVLNA